MTKLFLLQGTPNTDGYREIVVYERRQVLIEHVILYDSNLKTPKAARQNSGKLNTVSIYYQREAATLSHNISAPAVFTCSTLGQMVYDVII